MCVALSSVETILILVRHGSALARPELCRVRFGLLLRLSACAERYPKWARGGASDRERERMRRSRLCERDEARAGSLLISKD